MGGRWAAAEIAAAAEMAARLAAQLQWLDRRLGRELFWELRHRRRDLLMALPRHARKENFQA